MKRCCYLLMLMLLSSSAYAGESYSFVVAGHRIHLEAPRGCNSTSCGSVSIPGIYETRRKRDRDDDAVPQAAPPKPPGPAPEPVSIRASAPPADKASTVPVVSAPPVAAVKPVACPTPDTSAPRPAAVQPLLAAPVAPPIAPAAATPPAQATPKISKVSHQADDEPAETPLGDWQTEGKKGSVRIERCGRALCGYVLDPASNATGEAVLINMRNRAASEWSGNIYSGDSKDTYYATIAMQGSNSLRVEACALGHFFCSANVWSRIGGPRQRARCPPPEP